MKKARNLWRDLPQGGSRYGSVLTRLFLLLCLLATTQAGWADTEEIRWAITTNQLTLTPTITSSGTKHLSDAATTISLTGFSTTSSSKDGYSLPFYKTNDEFDATTKFASITFKVEEGYTFTPTNLGMTVFSQGTGNLRYKAVISDSKSHSVTSDEIQPSSGGEDAITFSNSFVALEGTVTIKLYAYGYSNTSTGKRTYIKSPITITGTTAAASSAATHSVTHTLSHVTKQSGSTGANAATEGTAYNATFAAETGYELPSAITVTIGGSTATADTDYTWNSSTGALTIPAAKVTGDIAITVTGTEASGSSTKYTLAWDSNGGSSLSGTYSNGEIEAGAAITKPSNPTKSNYTFGGWFTNNDGTGDEAGSTMPEANTTYYAKWTQTVTLNANTSYNGSGSNTTASATWNGTSLTGFTPTTPKTGYKLVGFYTSNTSGTKVLNADGSFASNSVSSWITNGKWSRTQTSTLYAHYEEDGVAIATAPTFDIRNGASNLEETSTRTYTIKDKTVLVKWRLNVQGYTYVRYTYGTTMPDDPTLTNGTVKDNTGNSGVANTDGFNIQNTDTYYIKVVAWNKDKNPESSTGVILYTFTTSTEPKVTFTSPTTTVEVGKTVTNTATLTNATGDLAYSSSNNEVATVDSETGEVTGVAAGTATITATYNDGSKDYTGTYTITVQGLGISTQPKGASYTQGATPTALTVSATRGTTPYSYQWYKNTDGDTSGKEGDKIAGATSATLATSNISTATVGTTYYYCIVTDAAATPASVTSNKAEINVTAAAAITAPALKIQSGDAYLEKIDDTHYTITDKSQQIKVRLYVEKNTYVRYTFGETMPDDPTVSTGTEKDNSSNGSRVESSNITFQNKDTYFVKAKAWNADKSQWSEVITYEFRTAGEKPSAPTITADGTTYTTNKSVTIATTADGGTTYYKVGTTAETSASAIAAGTAISGNSQTITASPASAESNIVVSVVTVKDGKYSDIVTATYTYNGIRHFNVAAANKTLQVGGRDNVDPYITYLDGTRFEIGDDVDHDLSYYFTFTYERTAGSDADVLVGSDGVINIPSTATPGNTATITITATPTTEGQTLFDSGSQTGTMTVTVKAKESGTKTMSFYWDPEFTQPVDTEEGDEWAFGEDNTGSGGQNEEKRSVFKNKYENGRMIYVKAEPGYEIWVATKASNNANDVTVATPTASINSYSNTNYSTTHGIPLYISGMSNGDSERTFVIGLKAYKAGTTEGVGSAVSARFRIEQTAAGQAKRPAPPTFSPTKTEAGTLSTAQTVAAVGATGSYVFSKFGSSTLGLGRFINYLEGTQSGREQVATFSTEVGDRDIKALQITGSGNEYYISEYGSVDDYQYNLAAKLLVTPATYYVNVGNAFTAPVLTKITTDQEEEPDASDYSSPTLTGYFYNKQKAEANAAPYQGLTFGGDDNPKLSYSIENFNGANASINATTGEVTIGNKSGYAIVTVNYAGGESYTIKTKKVGEKTTTTSPMTATYRINIVDPNEYLPIINPTSRKFANSLDVTISVPDENHYVKYVVADGEEVKTAEEVKAAGETINKNSRVTVTVGEDINVGDKVSVYAIAYDDNGVTSTVVKETYTKVTPLQKPTLSPDGVTKPYEYTETELAVAAVAYNAGAVIYYTTDGSDPTKSGAKTYDGASKILVEKEDGTTIVKAAAYFDGIYSDVVTGTYVPTDNLAQPWFLVNGTKVEGTEMHISTTDVITIDNDRTSSSYYYTLDGTAPSVNEGEPYTAGFHIYKTVTAKAIATENGLISPATTVTFIIDDEGNTKKSLWEAIEETTPKGTMDAGDRKVSAAAQDAGSTSSTIYVENLTATFGGFDNNDWNKTSIGEKTQGAAMDGVGKYSIRNIMDVKEETDRDYDPTNMLIESVHGRTHALPSQGAYVKFEPEKDGVLTIWALQQGGLHYSADGDFCSRFIRFRPVFMVDETGKSIAATTAESTACLSKNWSEVESDNWLPRNSGDQNGDKNLYYSDDQNTAIYNMYTTWMSNNSISDGGSIKPFKAPKEIYPTLFTTGSKNAADYAEVYGYVMPSGGNVKYTFNVQAGKTYFFFGFRTKLGIRGFKFEPTTTDLGETVTLPQNADATTFISTNNGQTKNVKLVRKVKKNIWTTFCLPFSVSETQLENIFGAGTQVMQFVNVDGYTMNVFKHYHHMIVAGTPILVCPTNDDMTEFTFNGVHIENVTPEEICDSEDDTYKFVGGYTPMTVNNGSYYIGNDGLWHKLNNTKGSSTLNGSRAYLKLKEGSNARALTLNITSFDGEEDYTTTGIANIESDGIDLDGVNDSTNKFDDNIYNVQGQLVRKNAKNFNGLTKGVYIINGKKVVIND